MTITCQVKSERSGWNLVITDAEAEIRRMKQRITQLKSSIRLFRKRAEAGETSSGGISQK